MRSSITRMTMSHDKSQTEEPTGAPVPHDERGFRALRSYAWCFTLNNYTDEEIRRLESLECERLVVGKEVAPTTGTPHLQGYIRFK